MPLNKKHIIVLTVVTAVGVIVIYKLFQKYKKLQKELKSLKVKSDTNAKMFLENNIGHCKDITDLFPESIKNILTNNPDSEMLKIKSKLNSNVNLLEQLTKGMNGMNVMKGKSINSILLHENVNHNVNDNENEPITLKLSSGNDEQDTCSETSEIHINDEVIYSEKELLCNENECKL